jgi:hypothetical protein
MFTKKTWGRFAGGPQTTTFFSSVQKKEIPMSIIVRRPDDYQPANEGTYLAIMVEVVDLGCVETAFGKKDMVRLIWAITDGGQKRTIFQRVTKSLHPKSQLGRIARVLMGGLPESEFDIELLVGRQAMVVIEHRESDGNTYANITLVFSPKGNVHGVNITDADLPEGL